MLESIITSPFFGLGLCTAAWCVGCWVRKKTGFVLCNPLIIAAVLIIAFLMLTGISYDYFAIGGDMLKATLGPVTVVLAVSVYEKRKVLGEHFIPVVTGCLVGSITSLVCVLGLCRLFRVDEVLTASMLPKSCTTAIAIGISESHGGITGIAVAGVLAAGVTGAVFVPLFAKLFRVKDPVEEGVAIGACSHALGTTKALEIGKLQGAMSSIAICICGIMTSVFVMFF